MQILGHIYPVQKGRLFSWIFYLFSLFRWSNFDLELVYFALSMNTSYSPQHRVLITVGERNLF